jgi:hypothetical protein
MRKLSMWIIAGNSVKTQKLSEEQLRGQMRKERFYKN